MLQSSTSKLNPSSDEPKSESVIEVLLPGFLCTLATDKKSADKKSTFWCMKIEGEAIRPACDDYGFFISNGCNYLQGRFLEKVSENNLN